MTTHMVGPQDTKIISHVSLRLLHRYLRSAV